MNITVEVDLDLLKEQKKALLEVMNYVDSLSDELNGLLNLIDAIQDYAVDTLGVEESLVYEFPEDKKAKKVEKFIELFAEKKDVIKDNQTNRVYWDTGIVRNFETVLLKDVTFEQAKKAYPHVLKN